MKDVLVISMAKKDIDGIKIDAIDVCVDVEFPDDTPTSQAEERMLEIFDTHADMYLESKGA